MLSHRHISEHLAKSENSLVSVCENLLLQKP